METCTKSLPPREAWLNYIVFAVCVERVVAILPSNNEEFLGLVGSYVEWVIEQIVYVWCKVPLNILLVRCFKEDDL